MKQRFNSLYPWTLFVLFLISCSSVPINLPPQEKLCPKGDCRGPMTITLVKKDGSIFERKYDYLYPIIRSTGISIFPGEQLVITGDFIDNKLTNISVLSENDKKPPLMKFSFSQENANMMVLFVENYSKYNIKYHLSLMPLEKDGLYKTSTCPLLAGFSAGESWPYPIFQLLVTEIFILEDSRRTMCEY